MGSDFGRAIGAAIAGGVILIGVCGIALGAFLTVVIPWLWSHISIAWN